MNLQFKEPSMTYSYELSNQSSDIKTQIRKLESIKHKIWRCKWSIFYPFISRNFQDFSRFDTALIILVA